MAENNPKKSPWYDPVLRGLDYTSGIGRFAGAGVANIPYYAATGKSLTNTEDLGNVLSGRGPSASEYIQRGGGDVSPWLDVGADIAFDPATWLTGGASGAAKAGPLLAMSALKRGGKKALAKETVKQIPLEKIIAEQAWNAEKLAKADITKPISLAYDQAAGKYRIGDGIHRYNKALSEGKTSIPAIVDDALVHAPSEMDKVTPKAKALTQEFRAQEVNRGLPKRGGGTRLSGDEIPSTFTALPPGVRNKIAELDVPQEAIDAAIAHKYFSYGPAYFKETANSNKVKALLPDNFFSNDVSVTPWFDVLKKDLK